MRAVRHLLEHREIGLRHAEARQGQAPGALVQEPQHDPLAVARRRRRDPHVHFPPPDAQPDAAVLGHALLGDVQFRQDLDPGDQERRQCAPGTDDLPQHTVDAEAHGQGLLEGLDVDVGSVLADGFGQKRVDQPDDGGVVALLQEVFGLRDGVGEARQVEFVAHVLDRLLRPRGVLGVAPRSAPARTRRPRPCAAATALRRCRFAPASAGSVGRPRLTSCTAPGPAPASVTTTPKRRANANGKRTAAATPAVSAPWCQTGSALPLMRRQPTPAGRPGKCAGARGPPWRERVLRTPAPARCGLPSPRPRKPFRTRRADNAAGPPSGRCLPADGGHCCSSGSTAGRAALLQVDVGRPAPGAGYAEVPPRVEVREFRHPPRQVRSGDQPAQVVQRAPHAGRHAHGHAHEPAPPPGAG